MLASFSKSLGLDDEIALRVACGFGGGVGRLGLTCGAVTGAVMVIGLKYGKVKADDDAAKEKTYALVQEFARRFRARNQSLNCTELLGVDLGTPEGREQVKARNLVATVCEKAVRDAAEILQTLV